MSKNSKNHKLYNASLGEKHNNEHIHWNRREFLSTGGLLGVGSLLLSGMPVSPLFSRGILHPALEPGDENILVLVKMFGGNDGLNMVFPNKDSAGRAEYLKYRPNIGLIKDVDYSDKTVLAGTGNSDYAIHGAMESMMPFWNEGKMAVVHNVGYPNQNYSHFSSIQLWSTAADDAYDERINSGVVGRYLNEEFPAFMETPPTIPPALRIGYNTDTIFTAPGNQQMELVFNDPNEFYRLAQYGKLYETDGFGDCPQGEERSYLRQLTNNSLRYSTAVTTAYNKSANKVTYPTGTQSRLAEQLAIVSRLIKGRLGTRVYMVYIDGFDTHSNQKDAHKKLMGDLSNSLSAFYNDLKADSAQSNVTMMTFSEFGRTIKENGSFGTDHGNLSPLFVIGDGVKGGHKGSPINLNDATLKNGDTIVYYETQNSTDYRKIYSTVLQDCLCLDPELVDFTLGQKYARLDLFNSPCIASSIGSNNNAVLIGHNPNISNPKTIDIKFSQLFSGETEIEVRSLNGAKLASLYNSYTVKGSYVVNIDPLKWKLAPGEYIYQLNSGGKSYMRRFNIF